MAKATHSVLCISSDGHGPSYFSRREIELNGTPERMLSEQQAALNFRLRTSDNKYSSDWHTAGDPTLLIILKGSIELELRDGSKAKLDQGEMFIAQDYLAAGVVFGDTHGHTARVVGENDLMALHLKLERR